MSETAIERMRAAFHDGTLLHPLDGDGNTVDLAQALSSLAGAPVEPCDRARELRDEIGAQEHYVVVIVDGLGMNLVERLPVDAFLRRHLIRELRAVYPSSTAPGLTSLATAAWPGEHAVLGWWLYLPDAGVTSTILPYVERFSNRPLEQLRVPPSYAFPRVARPTQFTYHVRTFMPAPIAGSTYTRYSSGDAPYYGYGDLRDAVEHIARRIRGATGPTYNYWYIPHVDAAEHTWGVGSPQTWSALQQAQACIAELASQLRARARIVVTADHGQIDVGQRHIIDRDDELAALIAIPPTGDPRSPLLHARDTTALRACFARGYENYALLSIDEAEELRLFGPVALSDEARRRAGDFVAVAFDDSAIFYEPDASLRAMVGVHGGLSPSELRIPLVVA